MKAFAIVSAVLALIVYTVVISANFGTVNSITHEECQEMSEALSMMTASEAHNTLIAKVRDMGCNEQHYPIGVLVK
jgi:hypothetical protein